MCVSAAHHTPMRKQATHNVWQRRYHFPDLCIILDATFNNKLKNRVSSTLRYRSTHLQFTIVNAKLVLVYQLIVLAVY